MIVKDKTQLRRLLQSRLLEMTEEQRNKKSKLACERLIQTEQFKQSSVIMVYLSLPHEVDTAPIILYAWQHGKTIAVPKVSWQQRHMIPVQINSLETGLATESSGLRNPITGTPMLIEDIDLVITPALGFDRNGNRLGRGGAYYDKFFDSKNLRAIKCGFAFSEQIIDSVPVDDHDEKVDFVVTDEEVIYITTSLQGG
jgi:5-formyltetrahydrofolate cyclo-ligase